jgi:cytochrome c-type biogenesis protein CcmH
MCRRVANLLRAICCVTVAVLSSAAYAVDPDERLTDPALEVRARAISAELRCLVCQNQSIDDSNAPLARDLRVLVRERLSAGNTDAQVMTYVVERYGEFILLRPPFGRHTLLLWLGPLALLLGVAMMLLKRAKKLPAAPDMPRPLSLDEQTRLNDILARKKTETGTLCGPPACFNRRRASTSSLANPVSGTRADASKISIAALSAGP